MKDDNEKALKKWIYQESCWKTCQIICTKQTERQDISFLDCKKAAMELKN